ncbi:MAG: hypothetical protein JKY09_04980 [Crocinitomicaceae bacterium]|nr:hypothetical protein [Crocinitomicaceae bacterium]
MFENKIHSEKVRVSFFNDVFADPRFVLTEATTRDNENEHFRVHTGRFLEPGIELVIGLILWFDQYLYVAARPGIRNERYEEEYTFKIDVFLSLDGSENKHMCHSISLTEEEYEWGVQFALSTLQPTLLKLIDKHHIKSFNNINSLAGNKVFHSIDGFVNHKNGSICFVGQENETSHSEVPT